MDTVDTGSPRAVGRGLPVATVSISPYGTREAMLQLICSNLDCNHGALRASLVLWLGKFLQIIALIG